MKVLVAARAKPGDAAEFAMKPGGASGMVVDLCDDNDIEQAGWMFDSVIPEHCGNRKICPTVVRPVVDHILSGGNGTLVAFGAKGTGKTHTMFGDENDSDCLVHGAAAYLFEQISQPQRRSGYENTYTTTQYMVTCSVFDIRDDRIRDMLTGQENLAVSVDSRGQTSICDLRTMACTKLEHVLMLINQAATYRRQHARSNSKTVHTVLQLGVERRVLDNEKSVVTSRTQSMLSMVDIGGVDDDGKNSDNAVTHLEKVLLGLREESIPAFHETKLMHILGPLLVREDAMLSLVLTFALSREERKNTLRYLEFAEKAGFAFRYNAKQAKPPRKPTFSGKKVNQHGPSLVMRGRQNSQQQEEKQDKAITPIPRRLSNISSFTSSSETPPRHRSNQQHSPDRLSQNFHEYYRDTEYDRIDASILDEVDSPEEADPNFPSVRRVRRLSEILTRPLDISFLNSSGNMEMYHHQGPEEDDDEEEDKQGSIDGEMDVMNKLTSEIDSLLADSHVLAREPKRSTKPRTRKYTDSIQQELLSIRQIQDEKLTKIQEELRRAQAKLALEEQMRRRAETELELERHKANEISESIQQKLQDAVFERSMLQRSLVQRQDTLQNMGDDYSKVSQENKEMSKRLAKAQEELKEKERMLEAIQENEVDIQVSRSRARSNSMAKAISVLGLTDGGLQLTKPPQRRTRTNSISSLAKSMIHIRRKSLIPSFKLT